MTIKEPKTGIAHASPIHRKTRNPRKRSLEQASSTRPPQQIQTNLESIRQHVFGILSSHEQFRNQDRGVVQELAEIAAQQWSNHPQPLLPAGIPSAAPDLHYHGQHEVLRCDSESNRILVSHGVHNNANHPSQPSVHPNSKRKGKKYKKKEPTIEFYDSYTQTGDLRGLESSGFFRSQEEPFNLLHRDGEEETHDSEIVVSEEFSSLLANANPRARTPDQLEEHPNEESEELEQEQETSTKKDPPNSST